MASSARDAATFGPGAAHPLLLVQAENGARNATQAQLHAAGHVVVVVAAGLEALVHLAGDARFAAVLCDPALFALPPAALLPILRAQDAALPVFFLPLSEAGAGASSAAATGPLSAQLMGQLQAATQTAPVALANGARPVGAGHPAPAPQVVGGHAALTRATPNLAGHFADALAALFMVYQPIVDGRLNRTFGLEALVRSSSQVLSHPGTLFDAAEQLDELQRLGRQIRAQVAHDLNQLPAGASGAIFVNLHTRDLLDDDLYDGQAPLSRHASRIVLEITERHALEEVTDVPRRIAALRALGYRIAIDDLGAGYASLTMLAQLEPEVVKLDMALVRDLQKAPIARRVVAVLANLCRDLKMLVIAEGIETLAERDILLQMGIDYLQGYYFGRPERQLKLAEDGAPAAWPTIEPRADTCHCASSQTQQTQQTQQRSTA